MEHPYRTAPSVESPKERGVIGFGVVMLLFGVLIGMCVALRYIDTRPAKYVPFPVPYAVSRTKYMPFVVPYAVMQPPREFELSCPGRVYVTPYDGHAPLITCECPGDNR